jgi:general L-amino acid transport system permease protein
MAIISPSAAQIEPASPFGDPRLRSALYQTLTVVAIVAFGVWVALNLFNNLERMGIRTGFEFLNQEAGFQISLALIPFTEASSYGRAIVVATINTVFLSAIAIVLSTMIGFVIGIARLSENWLLARLMAAYVELFRNLPLLLQIFFVYFAVLRPLPGPRQSVALFDAFFLNNRGLYMPAPVMLPGFWLVAVAGVAAVAAVVALAIWARRRQNLTGRPFPTIRCALLILIGVPLLAAYAAGFPIGWDVPRLAGFNFAGGLSLIPEFVAMVVALATYHAAFVAEIVRSGILAVKRGQVEAARALGLSRGQIYRRIVIPQALRVIVPPLTNQYLNLMKGTALAAAIGYPELMHVLSGAVMTQTGQAIEVMAILFAIYLAISLVIAMFMNWYNHVTALVER